MPADASSPIFLHGLWRSGSTFAWSRFRAAPGACAFFEQLYPGLARLTAARIGQAEWCEAVSDNRHPQLAAPYYQEFSPLLRRPFGRGVQGYRRSFAFDRFVLGPEDRHRGLHAYHAGLIAHAQVRGERAVLGCNRTWLRVGWLQARFGGVHIHVERDPLAVWASYAAHAAQGNFSYFTNLHRIVERNAAHPLFRRAAGELWLRRGLHRLRKPGQAYPAAFAALRPERSYALVYHMWLLAALQALGASDLVLDSCRAEEPGYRQRLQTQLGRACGLEVDLSGLRRVAGLAEAAFDRTAVEREVIARLPRAALALVGDARAARRRVTEFAPAKAAQLDLALRRLQSSPVRGFVGALEPSPT